MSSTRRTIQGAQIITDGDMSGTVSSTVITLTTLAKCKIELSWTGTPNGTFAVNERLSDAAPWVPLDFGASITATGSGGQHVLNINEAITYQIQVVYTPSSGSGTLEAWLKAQEA